MARSTTEATDFPVSTAVDEATFLIRNWPDAALRFRWGLVLASDFVFMERSIVQPAR